MAIDQRKDAICFEVVVKGNPIAVVAKPYKAANTLPRFRVSLNNGPVCIFGLDPDLNKVVVLDSGSQEINPHVAFVIGSALLNTIAA